MLSSDKPVKVFISYAHRDQKLVRALQAHLSLLRREGIIEDWHDRMISPGTAWESAVSSYLETADLILLLISPDFMASDYCYNIEMRKAMERHSAGEALVIPIILHPTLWEESPFGKLQCLPTNGIPLTHWRNMDEAFLNIAEGITKAVEGMGGRMPNIKPIKLTQATSDVQAIIVGHDHHFGHSNRQISDRGMRDQQRLNRKIDGLQRQWELLNEKLSKLNEQLILETQLEEKLRLTKSIDDTKIQRDQVEEQLNDMESQLAKVDSDAKKVAGRNDDQGLIVELAHLMGKQDDLEKLDSIASQLPTGEKGVLHETRYLKEMISEICQLQRKLNTQERPFLREPTANLLCKVIENFHYRVSGFAEPLASEFRTAAQHWLSTAQKQYQQIIAVL